MKMLRALSDTQLVLAGSPAAAWGVSCGLTWLKVKDSVTPLMESFLLGQFTVPGIGGGLIALLGVMRYLNRLDTPPANLVPVLVPAQRWTPGTP